MWVLVYGASRGQMPAPIPLPSPSVHVGAMKSPKSRPQTIDKPAEVDMMQYASRNRGDGGNQSFAAGVPGMQTSHV
jgi:hypothetical protein